MTKEEQVAFVRSLSDNIREDICRLIDEGKTPETWDGHELRVLIYNRHCRSVEMSEIWRAPRRKRAKDFQNHIIITPGL